jgi:predicted metalloprotease with PDZ domain
VLDLAIRGESNGIKSLDDVVRALYAQTKDGKPGFAETRIRELCIEMGGPNLGPIYDECVNQAVEFPIAAVLAKVGMKIETGIVSDGPSSISAIGRTWPK